MNKLIILLIAFSFIGVTSCCFAKENALSGLNNVRLNVNVLNDSGLLSLQLRNMLELKLRQAGLAVEDGSVQVLQINVCLNDMDSTSGIIGKFATIQMTLAESVFLKRNPAIMTVATTWEGLVGVVWGPSGYFEERIRQWSSDLADEFVNKWLKYNQPLKRESYPTQ